LKEIRFEKKLDDLDAADFPGVDKDAFFEWWKEMVYIDESTKTETPHYTNLFNRYSASGVEQLLSSFKLAKHYLDCKRLQKEAGIDEELLKKFAFYKPFQRQATSILVGIGVWVIIAAMIIAAIGFGIGS
jgi:hypothetical protein